jgi:hypothetical protein
VKALREKRDFALGEMREFESSKVFKGVGLGYLYGKRLEERELIALKSAIIISIIRRFS